jgi:hypothetical protein
MDKELDVAVLVITNNPPPPFSIPASFNSYPLLLPPTLTLSPAPTPPKESFRRFLIAPPLLQH